MSFLSQEWRDFFLGIVQPGIGLKRWVALLVAGIVFLAMGIAFAMSASVFHLAYALGYKLTLGGLSPLLRGGIFLGIGLLVVLFAVYRLLDLISKGNRLSRGQKGAIATLYRHRQLDSGPHIVAIGGGTGLSSLLRGLKEYSSNITAIVAITDDGGSSGRLRSELGIPPPGDARACLVALSDAEPFVQRLFTYRFNGTTGLGGHSLGNLMLAALTEMEQGFQQGLDATTNLLGLHGRVVPVSLHTNLVLMAETVAGERLVGESAVGNAPNRIASLWLEPRDAVVNPEAVKSIQSADFIVIGPGSLYTSVLPNFLLAGLREALAAANAPKVYVCNVATQWRETDGYTAEDHVKALHAIGGVDPTHVLVNTNVVELPGDWSQKAIYPTINRRAFGGEVIGADLVDDSQRTRHNADKLARAILSIANKQRVPNHKRSAPVAAHPANAR
ncbi:MAG: YvcK family protein [Chloroflexi bacterium]|nr:YvcK family protein [Chloroflexota bacterium]